MSKLTDEAVLAIRASTLSKKELAAMYGVSGCTIRDIRVGDTWTHLLPK
jgi:hypothetical protein